MERLCLPRARFVDKRALHAGLVATVELDGIGVVLDSAFRTIFLDLCLDLAMRLTIFIGWSPGVGFDLLKSAGGWVPSVTNEARKGAGALGREGGVVKEEVSGVSRTKSDGLGMISELEGATSDDSGSYKKLDVGICGGCGLI